LNAGTASFLDAHVQAFAYFTAVPRVCLYDNLRSAVLERSGDAIRFNPTLLELAAWYHFQPRPVAVARGNEKGRSSERSASFATASLRPGATPMWPISMPRRSPGAAGGGGASVPGGMDPQRPRVFSRKSDRGCSRCRIIRSQARSVSWYGA